MDSEIFQIQFLLLKVRPVELLKADFRSKIKSALYDEIYKNVATYF